MIGPQVMSRKATPPDLITQTLTPPPTEARSFTQAPQVCELFKAIHNGTHCEERPWISYQFVEGEYNYLKLLIRRENGLLGFVEDKIRYDYNIERRILSVRMPTRIHEMFIARVEKAIETQLDIIRNGSGKEAKFAERIESTRSTDVFLPYDSEEKHVPDASFGHDAAIYPGVIFEIAYSQSGKKPDRLADQYILDSKASIQIMIGFDLGYKKQSPIATFSVWRPQLYDGELKVVQTIHEEFRNNQGEPTDCLDLTLQLSDFAHEDLAKDELGDVDCQLSISPQELYTYLNAAEAKQKRRRLLSERTLPSGVKIRRKSSSPAEELDPDDEEKYTEMENQTERRMMKQDPDYLDPSTSAVDGNDSAPSNPSIENSQGPLLRARRRM